MADKEKADVMLGTKDVASKLKVDPKYLRRVLRTLPQYKNNSSARYNWKENDPLLAKLPGIIEKFKKSDEAKKADSKKTNGKAKEAAAKGKEKETTTKSKATKTKTTKVKSAAASTPNSEDTDAVPTIA